VLCIRNDRDDNLGIAPSALESSGVAVEQLDGFDLDGRWPGIEAIGGLIVFGGEMNVDEVEAHPYLLRERQLMADAISRRLPVLGICLGAQMLARALGASVRQAPVRELGFKSVRLTEPGTGDPLLSAFGQSACVFHWHEDTFDLPQGAELLAAGDEVTNQAFRYGDRAWGVQFHFEVNQDGIDAWLNAAGSSVEKVWKRTAREVRQEAGEHLTRQHRQGRAAFAAFGRTVREGLFLSQR
jgi:GMP synthase-like glutamine amidotransferase